MEVRTFSEVGCRVMVQEVGASLAEDVRGVAIGVGEDGRVVVACSRLGSLSAAEEGRVAEAVADLLAALLRASGGRTLVH